MNRPFQPEESGLAGMGRAAPSTGLEPKRTSITDIAHACECSIATVSLVLNERGRISAATKKRVLKAAARLGYVPNTAGRSLRLRRTNTIGLFFYPSCARLFRNVFYAEVMEGLEQHLGAAGYDLLLSGSDFSRGEGRPMRLITQRRVDAAIMLGAFPFTLIERLSQIGGPFLLLDSNLEDLPIDSVTTDGFSAGRMVVEHLHARGHRRIVMLAYDLDDYNIDLRARGFIAGLQHHRLPVQNALIRNFKTNDEGLPFLLRRLRSASRPTAVVCVNDTLAVYMMQRTREAGFRVPADVSFVGYDDDVFARDAVPKLTTVAVNKPDLGRTGAECLLRRLREPNAPVSKARLPVHLIERESVAAIGGNASAG
jgi:LacI family transcriptional regulator